MKTNKLKIHCFDDESIPASWVEIAICPFHKKSSIFRRNWTKENVEYKRFQSVGEAISYYEETNNYPDLIAIDIDSRELHPSFKLSDILSDEQIDLIPLRYRVDDEKTSTRGKQLMEYAIENFPNSQMFYISSQFGNTEVFNKVVRNAFNEGLTAIPRDKAQGFYGIQLPILEELKKVAKKYLYKLDSYTKIELKNKLCELNKGDFLDLKVNIDYKEYHIKDILIAYLPLEENEFKIEINKLFFSDLSLAASECFGILGIKQITHDTSNFYFKDARLFQKINNQIDLMFNCINEISNENITEKLSTFRNDIEEFTTEFKNNNNQVYSEILRVKRNDNFQFKGDSFNDILGEEFKDYGNSDNFFELNIPIHKIFEIEFGLFLKSILEKSSKGASANRYSWFSSAGIVIDKTEIVETYTIKLFNNFIGFYHDGNNIFNPEDTNHYQANWLKSFQKNLNYFGKLYILKKETENEYTVFDCTYDSVINLGNYSEWKCVLKDKIKSAITLEKNNYFVFSFLTKKPKN